ncbi:MAG TPA: DUF3857 domain-containing transglutaminase family protein [Rectinemataceae bacterium]|nr:DUF3857 domain-containing transglutaminase family protein [Rectinemataceae bacterium]
MSGSKQLRFLMVGLLPLLLATLQLHADGATSPAQGPAAAPASDAALPAAFTESPQALLARFSSVQSTEKAAYQVLAEEDRISYDGSGGYSIVTHEIVRVLSTEGVNQWSVLDVDWQPWRDSRPGLRARVIRAPGLESLLSQDKVVESSAQDGDYNLRSDSRRLSAPLPNLEPNALIEFELVESGKEARPGAGYARRIFLARRGPVEARVVSFEYPEKLPFTYQVSGSPVFRTQKSVAQGRVTLVLNFDRLPGHSKLDPLVPYDVSPLPALTFGTAASWAVVAKAYYDATEPLLGTGPLKDYARKALGGVNPSKDPKTAVRLVADSIRRDVRYTGIYFGENAIIPHAPADTLASGYGDCKDQASLLAACLQSVGIDARLVLLMAGTGYDADPGVPGLELFNHAIVRLPKLDLWIDPTDIFSPAGSLPYEDQGRRVLVVDPGTAALTLTPKTGAADNWYRIERDVTLSESGKATQIVEKVTMGGSVEARYRARFSSGPRKDKLDSLVKAGKSDFDTDSVDADFSDPADLGTPFHTLVTARGSSKGWTDDDNAEFVMRGGDAFSQLPQELELDSTDHDPRSAEVFLPEATTTTVEYRVNAPAGFKLSAVPDPYSIDLGPATLKVSFSSPDPQDLVADFTLVTLRDRFPSSDLDALRTAAKKFFDSKAAVASFASIGQELLNAGQYQAALAEFKSLQQLHPKEALHHVQASRVLLAAGLAQDALAEAEAAVALEPDSATAHKNLAFVSLSDPFGRQFGPGSDVGRTLAEYQKAYALDSSEYQSLFNYGIVEEFGSDGLFRGRDAHLADAVAAFAKAPDELERYGVAERYLGDLFFLGRYDDVIAASAGFKDRSHGAHFLLAAMAMKSGSDATLQFAAGLLSDLDKRRSALNQAGIDLLAARQFAVAADLFTASARGTSNFASTADYARRIRDVRRYDPTSKGSGPEAPLLVLLDGVLDGKNPSGSVFVPAVRAAVGAELDSTALAYELSKVQGTLTRIGLSRDPLMDLIASKMSVTTAVQGRAILATAAMPDFGADHLVDLMLERSGDGYLIVDVDETIGIGAQMQALLGAGDLAGARDWLTAIRDSKKLLPSFASALSSETLALLPVDDASVAGLSLAAAVLSRGSSDKTQAATCLKTVVAAADGSNDPATTLGYLNLALGFAATTKDSSIVALADRQKRLARAGAQDAVVRVRALGAAGLNDAAAAAALEARDAYPQDLAVLRSLRYALGLAGRHAEALAVGESILSMSGAQPSDYNNTAWEMLFQAKPDFGIINSWGLTQRLSNDDYSLHTLCCLYSVAGRSEEALAAFQKYLSTQDVKKTDSALWLAHGLLARSFGMADRAQASLKQAVAVGDSTDATGSAAVAALWAQRP